MPLERKVFVKLQDLDTVKEFIENGAFREGRNIHVGVSDTGNAGVVENLKGNTAVVTSNQSAVEVANGLPLGTLSQGTFKVIGAKEDIIGSRVFYFVKNTNPNGLEFDRILEYSWVTGHITFVAVSILFKFSIDKLITGINVVDSQLLYWTDDNTSPKKINIDRAKDTMANGLGYVSGYQVFDQETIEAIKYPPLFPPTVSLFTDFNRTKNNCLNKNFQFKYFYFKDDGEESACSPISEVTISQGTEFLNPAVSTLPSLPQTNNGIKIDLTTGHPISKKIGLLVREGNIGDFFLIDTLDKEILNIPSYSSYTYTFYNDKLLAAYDLQKSNQLFDNLPRLAKAQEYIDGNVILYGNTLEGYDNPKDLDVSITPTYTDIATAATFTWTKTFPVPNGHYYGGNGYSSFHVTSGSTGSSVDGVPITINGYSSPASALNGTFPLNYGDLQTLGVHFTGGTITFAEDIINNIVYITIHATTSNAVPNTTINPYTDFLEVDFVVGTTMILPVSSSYGQYYFPEVGDVIMITDSTSPYSASVTHVIDAADIADYSAGAHHLVTNLIFQSQGSLNYGYTNNGLFEYFRIGSLVLNVVTVYRTTTKLGSFKSGAVHPFGLVYYDYANRSGTTVRNEFFDVYAKFLPEQRPNLGDYIQRIGMDWSINHLPPDWATHYQWVYTGNATVNSFLQMAVGSVPLAVNGITSEISMQPLINFNIANPTDSVISYSWTKGDRVRFITNTAHDAYSVVLDVEVLNFYANSSGVQVLVTQLIDTSYSIDIQAGTVAEIYTPKPNIEAAIYYEFGKCYEIGNAGDPLTAFHYGELSNQSVANGVSLTPATGHFNRGDVWIRPRHINIAAAGLTASYVDDYYEDYNISDFYASKYWDKGRPNRVTETNQAINGSAEFREIRRQTTIPYSDVYVPETNINGLSRFYDFNFETYDHNFGSIQKLYSANRVLEVYQELKTGIIPVRMKLGTDSSNNTITYQTDQVLNEIRYYEENFGIGLNPESFAANKNARYGVDVARGHVWRRELNGLTSISQSHKIHSEIVNLFRSISQNPCRVNIYGVFNRAFSRYEFATEAIPAIQNITLNIAIPDNVTRVFIDADNEKGWCGQTDYHPEMMVEFDQDILTFKDGVPYTHNTNPVYGQFYGVNYPCEISVPINASPEAVKKFLSINQETNSPWDCYEITNNQVQLSELAASDFEFDEGKYKASFLFDMNTPNIQDALINGDVLTDVVLFIKMRNNSTSYVRLTGINVNYIFSMLTP